ncbi:trans-sialidase, putative, partial [Trypanosoma cruzi marinkellei]
DGRWMTVIHGGGRQKLWRRWDPGRPCQVVLRHDTGEWDLYINTNRVYFGIYRGSLQERSISHIQFHKESVEVGESSNLSLINVYLYNKKLSAVEIRRFKYSQADPKYDDDSFYSESSSEEGSRDDSSKPASASEEGSRGDSSKPVSASEEGSGGDISKPASASEEGSRGDSFYSESSSQKESEEVSFVGENVSWVLLLLLGLWGFAALY